MAKAQANGIEIEWDERGSPDDPAILLIMGLGAQMTRWTEAFMAPLAARGFRVIRFDNRDVGLSSKLHDGGIPDLVKLGMAMATGGAPDVPYRLDDMADDAVALLDAIGVDRAHIVGASMGGMIGQLIAVNYPNRVLSLTSIMSTTGNPMVPGPTPEANAVLMTRPAGTDMDSLVAHTVKSARVVGSPGYPADEAMLAARARADLERMIYPQGFARQIAAVYADGDRRSRLARIAVPTLVIHGAADPLVPVEGGRDTAASIPGAKLVEIAGMGHDLPAALIGQVTGLIADHAEATAVLA